ncbi:DUF6506 family protein [Devosia sediminis]|uniref:Uncharacterized protein n=1 Tax=Devosia sediminis TaxID=2798801 RepID=A0A934IU73_9HYPH|nr:DUF6506 family protein [Devosia sediminis]MBJ3783101.1 hypothetical protein [Devosia sediminis]
MKGVVIFEVPGARPDRDRILRKRPEGDCLIVAVDNVSEVSPIAVSLVEAGFELVELCGGISPKVRHDVRAATGDRARVSSVTFGIESLASAARFNDAFNRGEIPKQAFVVLDTAARPGETPEVMTPHSIPTPIHFVKDAEAAADVVRRLVAEDVLLVELYGGFSTGDIAMVINAAEGRAAIGSGGFAIDALTS